MAEEFALSVALCVKVSHVSHDKKILLYFFFEMQLFFFSNSVFVCKCSADKHSKPQQGSHGKYIRR